ncbi:MAG: hypothetical protein GY940_05170, partial [bacterium]|nr:hypothetical protein [bacterium]
HHIISDGWSMVLINNEFMQLYQGFVAGDSSEPEGLTIRYRDFTVWHNREIGDVDRRRQAHLFWKEKVEKGIVPLTLPMDYSRTGNEPKGGWYRSFLEEELLEDLKKVAMEANTTLFTVMFSIYILFLHRFTNREDISCSIINAGRDHEFLHNIIGYFVNSVLFTIRVDYDEPFLNLLQRVNTGVLEIFRHQSYPLELVFEELNVKYPDLPVSFNMFNISEPVEMKNPGDDSTAKLPFEPDIKFDLEPYVTEYQNGIGILWAYARELFKPDTIEYMVARYREMIDFFGKNPGKSYSDYQDDETEDDAESEYTFTRD